MVLNTSIQKQIQTIFDKAGVKINGTKPYDIKLLDEKALKRIIRDGSLGLGETYMEGMWQCDRLDELSYRLFKANLESEIKINFFAFLYYLSQKIINYQTKKRAKKVAQVHYNLDNNLFEKMLDKSMAYSCGYWKDTDDLNAAQIAKYELICKKLYLTVDDYLLDMGCGWGGLAAYVAEHIGCKVVAVSNSVNQISFARERYKHLPISFHLADYRETTLYNPGKTLFTKLVSVGAFEHIGYKNYKTFFKLMAKQLSDEGVFLLHSIGSNTSGTATDPWINKYIFPNSNLPSMVQITQAIETLFIVEDWHNFGAYYDKTLLAWHVNFVKNWDSLKAKFDQRFYRMWSYYLLMCAGMFRARAAQLWQIVLSKPGILGGYESFR